MLLLSAVVGPSLPASRRTTLFIRPRNVIGLCCRVGHRLYTTSATPVFEKVLTWLMTLGCGGGGRGLGLIIFFSIVIILLILVVGSPL